MMQDGSHSPSKGLGVSEVDQRACFRQAAADRLHVCRVRCRLESAEVIEEASLESEVLKELLLLVDWKRPLHVVLVVDSRSREERIVTVYEPHWEKWSSDYRERR